MGGRVATNENPREVFVRGSISGFKRRSYPALQELDTSSFLPSSKSRRDYFTRYGFKFNDWIRSGLFRDGLRLARQEVRPLGRRINFLLGFPVNWNERAKND